MANPLEYIRNRPKLAKQMSGLSLAQLEQLIKQALPRCVSRGVSLGTA